MRRYISILLIILLYGDYAFLWSQDFNQRPGRDTLVILENDTVFTLLYAASRGDSARVSKLLLSGVQADATTNGSLTALMYAIMNGHTPTARLLVDNGARLDRKVPGDNTALIATVQRGNHALAEYLIRKGADINLGDSNGVTPLMYAVGIDSFALADMLLYYDADVNRTDSSGVTALLVASVTGNIDLAARLLSSGADANARSRKDITPLHAAIWFGYWNIAELLLEAGADPNSRAKNGYAPVSIAVEANDLYATSMLVSFGADVNQPVSRSLNPLTIAVENNNDSLAAYLRDNQARYNYRPSFEKFGLGTDMTWFDDDYLWGFYVAGTEMKYNLNLRTGGAFRPSAIRVLEEQDENTAFQYWERRGELFISLDKSVYFFHGSNSIKAGFYGGIKGIYTFGSYRGMDTKPHDRIMAAPGVGLTLDTEYLRLTLGYEYHNLKLYKISPNRINISIEFRWNRKINHFKPEFIPWF
jgi:ankyrin repeat protein